MTTPELIAAIAEAPAGVVRDREREALRAHKASVLSILRKRRARAAQDLEGLAGRPLYRLTNVLEVAVPWTSETLFIVPGPAHAAQLDAEGITRGRMWDTAELLDLVLTSVTPEDARSIAESKLTLRGAVMAARDRRS